MKMQFVILGEFNNCECKFLYKSPVFESMDEFRKAEWALKMNLPVNEVADEFEKWSESWKIEDPDFVENCLKEEGVEVDLDANLTFEFDGKMYRAEELEFGIIVE
jgi:hypothetical protein